MENEVLSMSNELLLIFELLAVYVLTVVCYRFFGVRGLCAFMAIMTIMANIEVLILVDAFGITQTLGNVLFAATFLITDILSENHGKKTAQTAVNIGILSSVLFIGISAFWLLFTPAAEDWAFGSISTLFAYTPRIVAASLIAYAICQKLDVWLYHKWWQFTSRNADRRRFLWLRNNGSTLVSQLLNAVLFNVLAFYGIYETPVLLSVIASSYLIFIFTSLIDTPFVYLARMLKPKHTSEHQQ